MKKILLLILIIPFLFSCSEDEVTPSNVTINSEPVLEVTEFLSNDTITVFVNDTISGDITVSDPNNNLAYVQVLLNGANYNRYSINNLTPNNGITLIDSSGTYSINLLSDTTQSTKVLDILIVDNEGSTTTISRVLNTVAKPPVISNINSINGTYNVNSLIYSLPNELKSIDDMYVFKGTYDIEFIRFEIVPTTGNLFSQTQRIELNNILINGFSSYEVPQNERAFASYNISLRSPNLPSNILNATENVTMVIDDIKGNRYEFLIAVLNI